MPSEIWNPWHGCHRYSEGCRNCYVYRRDGSVGRDASVVEKTQAFLLPVSHARGGGYRIPSGAHLFCCMTSDFFVEDADPWRADVWRMMRLRRDVTFTVITKRIVRFLSCIPDDWGTGYPNVRFVCTIENQRAADARMPVFVDLPIRHKSVACEPLLGPVDLSPYLKRDIRLVVAGGESGEQARVCDYRWVLSLRDQCLEAGAGFWFKQTGARFFKDGRLYCIPRRIQGQQARKAGIDLAGTEEKGC